jgi:cytochrome c551/c552
MIKKILLAVVVIIIIIQFIRPSKNLSDDTSKDISVIYAEPEEVKAILGKSCNDCHSNKTVYPWYAQIQPVGWWLNNHVVGGKRHLNLNNFTALKIAVQKKKLEDFMEQIKNGDMPLSSYTIIHKDAKLSEADKQILNAWCRQIIDTIKAKYPADSLILEKQKRD